MPDRRKKIVYLAHEQEESYISSATDIDNPSMYFICASLLETVYTSS